MFFFFLCGGGGGNPKPVLVEVQMGPLAHQTDEDK